MVIPYLPRELESDILSRVPATSLRQLRFACKRWYALCKDPSFIKKNSQCKAAETQMVLKKDVSVFAFTIDIKGIHDRYDQFIQITGKLESRLKDVEDIKISDIFQCNGLLLCTTKDNRIVVWNPCTGQTRWIIQSNRLPSKIRSTGNEYFLDKYFLGYESKKNESCHSYKILRCYSDIKNAAVAKFEMYEFNFDSWRVLDMVTPSVYSLREGGGLSLKGNTYWLDPESEQDHSILRFDFKTERFGRLPLPLECDDDYCSIGVVKDEKLAVLDQSESFKMKIWMTSNTKIDEAKDLSWSQFLVVDLGKFNVDSMGRGMSFLVDEENKRIMYCDKMESDDEERTRIYICGEDIHKQVYRGCTNESQYDSPLLLSYVPSLVQIPAKQSNPGSKRQRLEELPS